jgi:hypothetical protein
MVIPRYFGRGISTQYSGRRHIAARILLCDAILLSQEIRDMDAILIGASVVALLVVPLTLGRCVFCKDGWRSSSSGGHGTCSWHGGIDSD